MALPDPDERLHRPLAETPAPRGVSRDSGDRGPRADERSDRPRSCAREAAERGTRGARPLLRRGPLLFRDRARARRHHQHREDASAARQTIDEKTSERGEVMMTPNDDSRWQALLRPPTPPRDFAASVVASVRERRAASDA